MDEPRHKIVVIEEQRGIRERLKQTLETANNVVAEFRAWADAVEQVRRSGADLLLLDATESGTAIPEILATVRDLPLSERIRTILLVGEKPAERAAALDLGADDAVSQPWDEGELLARVRAQLRKRGTERDLREKVRIAEEGQQIAHTAFEALAVTEKMKSDAYSLGRELKIGVGAAFAAVIVMVGVYFLMVRTAQHQTRNMSAIIAQLNGDPLNQHDLMSRVRQMRQKQGARPLDAGRAELKQQADDLKARMAGAEKNSAEIATLEKQLADTNARLKRVEQSGDAAETLIAADVDSVCLLHVSVAFRDKDSGRRLRYAGLNPQGEPIRDSDGNPVLTLDGRGPEVKTDIFGTGFLAASDGLVVTNHHVAEPWWKNDQLGDLTLQGFQPEISAIRAYFPGRSRGFRAEIEDISQDADLATMRVDLEALRLPVLATDASRSAAVPGEAVVLMGYATGLAAILARADEATVDKIADSSGGDVSQMLDELAGRNLIHPIVTQGHIGDILPDKILFDAQTTSGGSGGPLFNERGKVIGVTYAVLRGFGGSNFGIPIRLSEPLLTHLRP
jgi:DNA-binding response OmpR family regulator/S1-C subfamily serine protease